MPKAVPRAHPNRRLRYIDLFAGCGGLSLGLEKAGPAYDGFDLVFAVEKSDMAAETFFHNFIQRIDDPTEWKQHLGLPIREQAERGLVVRELKALLDDREFLASLRLEDIDLVAGGPPCQGFSMAGLRNPDDLRNELPWQFLEFVEAVSPRAVVIENVVGINQDFDKRGQPAPFTQLGMQLEKTGLGYVVQRLRLNAQHFGVPQHRPRMVLIGLRTDIAAALDVSTTDEVWKSGVDAPLGGRSLVPDARFVGNSRTVEQALWDIREAYEAGPRDGAYAKPGHDYAKTMRSDTDWFPPAARDAEEKAPGTPPNHKRARHSEKTTRRFKLYQYLAECDIPVNVVTVDEDSPEFERVERDIRLHLQSPSSSRPRFPWRMPDGSMLARSASDVVRLVKELHTKKHSQRPLHGDKPSPTVLTLPDDFVHYQEPRIHTVRELARLQSFPDTFVFRAKETTGSSRRRFEVPQYTQVGNAVPPMLGKAIGDKLHSLLARDERPRD